MKRSNPQRADKMIIYLFLILFFISFIKSPQLLLISLALALIYAFKSAQRKSLIKLIKSLLSLISMLFLPMGIRFLITRSLVDLEFTLMIIGKIIVSALILAASLAKYSPLDLANGILQIGMPPLLNRIFALTFRYFHMINNDVQIGRKALISRGSQKRRGLAFLKTIGEWIGGFFLKSTEHSEMVFRAMKARGFNGNTSVWKYKKTNYIKEAGVLTFFLLLLLILEGRF